MRDDWSILTWLDLTWKCSPRLSVSSMHAYHGSWEGNMSLSLLHQPQITSRMDAQQNIHLIAVGLLGFISFLWPQSTTPTSPISPFLSYQWFAWVKLCKSFLWAPVYHTHFLISPSLTNSLPVLNFARAFSGALSTTPTSPSSPSLLPVVCLC